MAQGPLRLAVLVSGGGTTLANICSKIDAGELPAKVVVVICSNDQSRDNVLAKGITAPIKVVPRTDHKTPSALSDVVWKQVREAQADLVCFAGFLSLLVIPDDYVGRVINIHPGLLPSFGGKGMWGHHVHEAVLAAGCKVSGCTVHFADQTYDTGPIIVQRTCPVLDDDTPDTLAARVFEQECIAYPQAIRLIAQGRIQIEGLRVRTK